MGKKDVHAKARRREDVSLYRHPTPIIPIVGEGQVAGPARTIFASPRLRVNLFFNDCVAISEQAAA